jgi:hypothetical protein
MKSKGDEGNVVVFHVHEKKTLGENYKEAYKLWRERTPITRTNIDAEALLNQKNLILKAKRITAVVIDEIKEILDLK